MKVCHMPGTELRVSSPQLFRAAVITLIFANRKTKAFRIQKKVAKLGMET